jgi:hypothetical protein
MQALKRYDPSFQISLVGVCNLIYRIKKSLEFNLNPNFSSLILPQSHRTCNSNFSKTY